MQLIILISEISYSSIATKNIDGIGGDITKSLLGPVPKKLKRNIFITAVKHFGDKIIQYINNYLNKKGLPLIVKDIAAFDAEAFDMELEFRLDFDDIDYNALIIKMYQERQRLINSEKFNNLFIFLDKIGEDRALEIFLEIFNKLSQDTKDELFTGFIFAYEEKIISLLNNFTKKKEWEIVFSKLEAKII